LLNGQAFERIEWKGVDRNAELKSRSRHMLDHHWRMVNLVVLVLITIATGVNALCRIADGKFTGVHQYALAFFGLFTLFLSVVTVMTMLRTSAHRRK